VVSEREKVVRRWALLGGVGILMIAALAVFANFLVLEKLVTLAENASRTLKKGMRIFVAGKLVQRTWQDESGNKRQCVEIQVAHVGPDLQFQSASVGPRSSAATSAEEEQSA
jgi:single-strand DNA-binding protein